MSKIFKCNEREFYLFVEAGEGAILKLSISTLKRTRDMYLKAPPQVFKYLKALPEFCC